MIHWTTPVPFCNLFPLLEFSSRMRGQISPRVSVSLSTQRKPKNRKSLEDETRPERERNRVSRPRKESGVDIARGGGGDTRLVETSRERKEGGEKKKEGKRKRKEARLGLRARA